jgi:hypothetical protein
LKVHDLQVHDFDMTWKCRCIAPALALGLTLGGLVASGVAMPQTATVLAQAMVPPTGMEDEQKPMPLEERMLRRFPQPVRVGFLVGLPVLDDRESTLGWVRQVVRTPQGKIRLIVSYSRWFGWFGRPVAVPIEVVGIHLWPATGLARYAAERICPGANLAGRRRHRPAG